MHGTTYATLFHAIRATCMVRHIPNARDCAEISTNNSRHNNVARAEQSSLETSSSIRHDPVKTSGRNDIIVNPFGATRFQMLPKNTYRGDEELAAVGVLAGVRHAQPTGAVVGELEVLVLEALAVDRLAAGAVAAGEVTA